MQAAALYEIPYTVYMNPKQLQFNYLAPTVHADGTNIFISVEGDVPRLDFFQVRSEDDAHVHADVVASVRFVSLEQLKGLQQSIEQTIKK
jgi:hypothetical protein